MSELNILNNTVFGFDARGVAKRFRHAAIFGALESLSDGETMRFVNDHDPLPLLDQLRAEFSDTAFTFTLCCGDDAAIAHDALRLGFTHIRCDCSEPMLAQLKAMGAMIS